MTDRRLYANENLSKYFSVVGQVIWLPQLYTLYKDNILGV